MKSPGRDDLIREVAYGRMSPDDAEAEAARLGLQPLASRPDPGKFDPMTEAWWTPPMTVAWIAWRDPQQVLNWYDPYRAECLDWHYTEWRLSPDVQVFKGYVLNERQRATLASLFLSEKYDFVTGEKSPGAIAVNEASSQLQNALKENSLQATGIPNNEEQRIIVPDREWRDLRWIEDKGRDVARYGYLSVAGYSDLAFQRRAVLALWPAKQPADLIFQLPPIVRPEGPGYFALYCAAQWIATCGGARSFDPQDSEIWASAFGELTARIASGDVVVTGVRHGVRERIEGHVFASVQVDHPFRQTPLKLILSDELYLCPSPYVDEEHWRRGCHDSLQMRSGMAWAMLMVLKSDIAKFWPFVSGPLTEAAADDFRSGAPGRPTSMHVVVAEHGRRLATGMAEARVGAEAEHLANWLRKAHPSAPQLTPKAIRNKISPAHRNAPSGPK